MLLFSPLKLGQYGEASGTYEENGTDETAAEEVGQNNNNNNREESTQRTATTTEAQQTVEEPEQVFDETQFKSIFQNVSFIVLIVTYKYLNGNHVKNNYNY
jgi:hypothetical protein